MASKSDPSAPVTCEKLQHLSLKAYIENIHRRLEQSVDLPRQEGAVGGDMNFQAPLVRQLDDFEIRRVDEGFATAKIHDNGPGKCIQDFPERFRSKVLEAPLMSFGTSKETHETVKIASGGNMKCQPIPIVRQARAREAPQRVISEIQSIDDLPCIVITQQGAQLFLAVSKLNTGGAEVRFLPVIFPPWNCSFCPGTEKYNSRGAGPRVAKSVCDRRSPKHLSTPWASNLFES